MKRLLTLFAALIAFVANAQVYPSPVRITRFTSSELRWTNQLAVNVPVYELLRSTTVTGNWQHFFFVTNGTSTPLTNSASANAPAVFHKLGWLGDTHMLFDYEFEEADFGGFGHCISGQLTVSLLNPGTWDFVEDGFCFDGTHVTGSGTLRPRIMTWTSLPHMARFDLTTPPEGQFLEAALQSSITNGTLVYTGMVGTVYQSGFAGETPLGTFRARRLQ